MPPDHSTYKEIVPAPTWVWLTVALTLMLSLGIFFGLRSTFHHQVPAYLWLWDLIWVVSIAGIVVVPVILGRLEILAGDGWLQVRFGWCPLIDKTVDLHRLERAEPVTYQPIRQFGGWGIRRGRFQGKPTAVYSVRGSIGVLLRFSAPVRVGSYRAEQVLIESLATRGLCAYLNQNLKLTGE